MAMTCPKCGAENTGEARFCRICGVQVGDEGFHEAPTRNFEQRPQQQSAPQPDVSPFATFGADGSAILPPRDPRQYVPPSAVAPPGAMMGYQPGTGFGGPVPTNPLHTGLVKKSYWGRIMLVIGGLVVFVLVCLIGLGILIANNVPKPVVVDDGKGGVSVSVPGGGPIVTVNEGTDPDSLKGPIAEWYYDGAKVENVVNTSIGGMNGSILEMTTDDDVDTVADFYRDKFADIREKQEIRNGDGEVVFTGGGTVVSIEPDGGSDGEGPTTINVVLGDMAGGPFGVPGVPRVGPAPPAPPAPPTTVTPATPAPEAEKGDGKSKSTTPPAAPAKP